MNCYVPKNETDVWDLIYKNRLYEELFLYRAEAGCTICENASDCKPTEGNEACEDCLNNPHNIISNFSAIRTPALQLSEPIRKIRKRNHLLSLIIGKGGCPLCSRKDWTGLMAAYFFDGNGNTKFGEVNAMFCPICGKEYNYNKKVD